jgi:hypothetical protein
VAFVIGSSLLGGCAHEPAPARAHVAAPTYASEEQEARTALRAFDLEPARPTLIDEAPTRAAFEERTGVSDPIVKAWTTFDVVTLAPLATWADRSRPAIVARLTHELCHAAIEQRFETLERARAARIPRFFEEGVCSVVAAQDEARAPLETLRGTPMSDALAAQAFRDDPARAYAAAHHLMAAARAGAPGCVERALDAELGQPASALWDAAVARAGDS